MKHVMPIAALTIGLCFSGRASAQGEALTPPVAQTPPEKSLPESFPSVVSVKVLEGPPEKTAPPAAYSLDNLKSGKLMEHGFSLGGAYAVHVPAKLTTFAARDINSSFMPYVVVYPLMYLFGSGEETRAYCAALWGLSPRADAQKIADQHAIERAREKKRQDENNENADVSDMGPDVDAKMRRPAENNAVYKATSWMPEQPPRSGAQTAADRLAIELAREKLRLDENNKNADVNKLGPDINTQRMRTKDENLMVEQATGWLPEQPTRSDAQKMADQLAIELARVKVRLEKNKDTEVKNLDLLGLDVGAQSVRTEKENKNVIHSFIFD